MSSDLLLIDNYDSFTYNLSQSFAVLGATVEVVRNDEIDVAQIAALAPRCIVLSPGPGSPDESGVCLPLLHALLGGTLAPIPLLGVCLGHQALAQCCGAAVVRAHAAIHGKVRPIYVEAGLSDPLLHGLPNPFFATRYHSLIVSAENLPPELGVSARSEDGEIMVLAHRRLPLHGVQFHPESFGTPHGMTLLHNFLTLIA